MRGLDQIVKAEIEAAIREAVREVVAEAVRDFKGDDAPAGPPVPSNGEAWRRLGAKAWAKPKAKPKAPAGKPKENRERRRWTDAEDRKVIELASAGVSRAEMARCLGRSKHATTQRFSYLRSLRGESPRGAIKRTAGGRKAAKGVADFSVEEIREMRGLRKDGESFRAIARAYETHHSTVRRLIGGGK